MISARMNTPYGSRLTVLAASIAVGLALAGCKGEEASAPPAAPAAPASSSSTTAPATPAGSTPSSSASSPAPTSPAATSSSSSGPATATTPGTPEGAANSLPTGGDGKEKPKTETAVDSKTTEPKGENTKSEEKSGMPEALHGNNHSSPALDGDAKKQ